MSGQTGLRQSNSKFRPEKTSEISISSTLACSILKKPLQIWSHLLCVMMKMDGVRFQ